jgi:hypothetical protein
LVGELEVLALVDVGEHSRGGDRGSADHVGASSAGPALALSP